MNETIYKRSHLEENDFCFSQISKAGDKCDFAQKYLFNNAANNFEDGFEHGEGIMQFASGLRKKGLWDQGEFVRY